MANRFLNNIRINDSYTLPSADGSANQVITTDGAGNLSFIDVNSVIDTATGEVYYTVKNSTGSTLSKGTAVMAVGSDGNSGHILVDKMVGDGSIEPRRFLGVLAENISNGNTGKAIHFGQIDKFDTRGQNGETWDDGYILWCDPANPGDFTATEPDGPNVKISAAIVLKASTNGKIQVRVQANEGIHDLHDTKITSQVDGDVLVWDNTTGVWFNDSTLNVDYTNGRVGIGTTDPKFTLNLVNPGNNNIVATEDLFGVFRIGHGYNPYSDTPDNITAKIQFEPSALSGFFGDDIVFSTTPQSVSPHPFDNASERMRITKDGNVGIGMTSPAAKLHVLGTSTGDATTKAEMLSNSVFSVIPHATNSGTLAIAQVDGGNSIGMQFTNGSGTSNWDISMQPFGGNVGIGTTSPSQKLTVGGNISATGTITGSNLSGTNTGDQDLSGYSLTSHNHDDRYYTESEANSRFVNVTGDTMTGTLTIDNGSSSSNALVIKGTSPTISLLDDDGGDDFYIHVNSNNFYVLVNRDANDIVGTGWESPHPLQIEGDTNIGYLFGNRMFADNYHPNADKWTTARTLSLTGDVSGSVSWDGSANASLSVTVNNDSHEHSYIKAGGDGPSTEDLNAVANSVAVGRLSYRGYNSSSTNKPPANDNANGVITVGQHSGGYNAQVAFSSDGNMYWRDNPGSTNGSWRTLWDSGNLDTSAFAPVSHTHTWASIPNNSVNSWGGLRHTTPSGYIDFGPANSGHAHIYSDRPSFYFNKSLIVNGDSTINTTDIRAGIFYDNDNTSYYADFAGNSRYNTAQGNYLGLGAASNVAGIYRLNMGGSIDMNNNSVHYVSQLHFNDDVRFLDNGNDSELIFRAGDSSYAAMIFQTGTTTRGMVYANSGNEVGFLDSGGSWAIRHTNDSGTRFYTDAATEEFRVGIDIVSGSYGTVQTSTRRAGWGGYSINGQYVLMSDHSSNFGMYNDIDNEWMLLGVRNADLRLYYNGSEQAKTQNGFFLANNQMRSPIFYDSNNTSYYLDPASTSNLNTLNIAGSINFGSSNGNINLSRGGWITFYEDGNANHGIGSRGATGSETDDIRINSYGAVYINLDSNNNNTSGADFYIGRHGSATGTISQLFKVSGETGNVGIGTTNPDSKLEIEGDTDGALLTLISSSGGSNDAFMQFHDAENGTAYAMGLDSSDGKFKISLDYGTNGSLTSDTKLVMDTSGKVGIGTTSPQAKLHVSNSGESNLDIEDTGGQRYRLFSRNSDKVFGIYDASRPKTWFRYTGNATISSTKLALLEGGGNVGIGMTNPSYRLQLSVNSAAKPSSSTWTVVSDERVKENIKPYGKGLNEILQVNTKTFDYNGKAGFDKTKNNVGIIAQDMIKIFPETIKTYNAKLNETDEEETELYNFDGHALTFALINAIQELKAEIDELKKQINK
jgi:hypothetical protein